MDSLKPRILIVDDVADNRNVLRRRFERRGFDVVEADGGHPALDLIARQEFDAVLLDIVMPDLDGLEVLKRVRTTRTPASLPIIMVTAKAENSDIVQALELGANDYLTKPVDFSIALARVQTQIARKQAEEDLVHAHHQLERHIQQLELEIAERKRSEAQVDHLTNHDGLTGLGNRNLLRDQLGRALARLERDGGHLALFCLNVDQFKAVNDTLGHNLGDELLRLIAARLQDSVSDRETVVRLGGDEFAIISTAAGSGDQASTMAHAIAEAIAAPYAIDGHQVDVTCSIGIALAPHDGADADVLLRNANMALTGAKADGRGACRFFEREMNSRAQARRRLELDLRAALGEGELQLYYQPLFNLEHAAITGFEALLRWNHPKRGMIPPSEFVVLAEDSGLIVPLGQWVLRQACEDAASWPGGTKVAVNISAVQFRSGNLVQGVMAALAASNLPADRLELEITETVLLMDNERTIATLHQLRGMGVRISMDDFGTGYSSLSYVRTFAFDKIKIDQSFIRDLTPESDGMAIVRAITSLARDLKIVTTAEGVETEQQLELLRGAGCSEVQGFLIGRPTPGEEVMSVLGRARPADLKIA